MAIYFDNAATTKIDKSVLDTVCFYSEECYANPSAMHKFGFVAEDNVKKANSQMSSILNANSSEIIWTSGGSESNNLAIRGYVSAYKKLGNHIITTKIEHASVLNVFKSLEDEGFDVTYLDVDKTGHIDIEELKSIITDKTLLVSIMYVNNEIGSVQNILDIGKVIKDKNAKTAFHVDAVQAFTKCKIDVKKQKIDFLSISSHKFNGPKGVGILYKNKDYRIKPLILGGGQQNGLRSGTLNVPGIMGTLKACDLYFNNYDVSKLTELRNYMIDKLNELNGNYNIIKINTLKDDTFAPHIVSVSFVGIRAEVMLHALEEREIYVSAGSACSSHDKKISSTLRSIGLDDKTAESTIRISFGRYNTKDEIDKMIEVLNLLVPKLLITRV